jgi:hypothetical protein
LIRRRARTKGKILKKPLLCGMCRIGLHYECAKNIEIDIRDIRLEADEFIANYALARTGLYSYIFACSCDYCLDKNSFIKIDMKKIGLGNLI